MILPKPALLQLIPKANPERIMMDFEKSAVNAFSTTFPTAQITGCYFHLCQSVPRKINEVGLKKAYTTTPELAIALKMVPATAFLPVEQVEDGFNLVMEEVEDILLRLKSEDGVSEKVEQFVCYFQKTYIRGTSRAPLYEPSIWNQNNTASEGLARTNNAVEGWNYGIQSLFSGSYPDVWTFLQKFRRDALLHKFNALQAVTGHQKKLRRKYQQLNVRVQTLIKSYDENKENIIPFLRSIAHLQWLIDTICYSSYYNLVLCVFEFFQKNAIFQKLVRIESPNFGAWIRAFSRVFSTLPRRNPVFPNSRKLEFV